MDGRLEDLQAEKSHLLDELEVAYRQIEEVLEAADYERRVTYEELREGQRVSYTEGEGPKGPRAENVKLAD